MSCGVFKMRPVIGWWAGWQPAAVARAARIARCWRKYSNQQAKKTNDRAFMRIWRCGARGGPAALTVQRPVSGRQTSDRAGARGRARRPALLHRLDLRHRGAASPGFVCMRMG